jgi:hypothetical protein
MAVWQEKYWRDSELEEGKLIRRFIDAIAVRQEKLRRQVDAPLPRRAFQAKTHAGISQARFRIDDHVAEDLQSKIFRPGAEYHADVRFSSASGSIQHDCIPDHRSLAVRLSYDGADSKIHIQDLLATNGPVTFVRDAEEFLTFTEADIAASRLRKFLGLFIRAPRLAMRVLQYDRRFVKRPIASLASETYWSRLPFAVGPVAVKFRFRPEPSACNGRPALHGFDCLREELVERLAQEAIVFVFEIQRFRDEATTPIEDATREWLTDFEPVARLTIPKQDLMTAEALHAQNAIETQAFNPWNTIAAFKPIGMLNRVRQAVYDTSADMRKGLRTQDVALGPVKARVGRAVFGFINRGLFLRWYRLPKSLALANLSVIRDWGRHHNLHDIPLAKPAQEPRDLPREFNPELLKWRHPAGQYNDLEDPQMGAMGTLLTRMVPLPHARPDKERLLTPNPRTISRELLTRDKFIPIPNLNLLAAAWIQFQVHGWFAHDRLEFSRAGPADFIEIPLQPSDPWEARHGSPMRVLRTPVYQHPHLPRDLPAYHNTETHWWDGSQLYSSSIARQQQLRENDGHGCRMRFEKVNGEEMLPEDPGTKSVDGPREGVDLTGFNDNYWLGLSLLHHLFAKEHNAICAALEQEYGLRDEELFQKARLIVAALLAKIHTLDWSTAVLSHPALQVAFDTYWSGIAGQPVAALLKRFSTHEVLHGLPGTRTMHHEVPYSMTEEFVSVYRMHPLLPDEIKVRSLNGDPGASWSLRAITGEFTRNAFRQIGFDTGLHTFGKELSGRICLHNYPRELQEHRRISKVSGVAEFVDMGTIDVLRDRERGIPRYNEFRRFLNLPPAHSFHTLTSNREWAREMKRIYGDVDAVDAVIGMLAEDPPPGFGFSETAFRVFIVMAARRQLSDRFFTTDYRPEIYTPLGLEWIQTNTLKTVLLRHAPRLRNALDGCDNPFRPWG